MTSIRSFAFFSLVSNTKYPRQTSQLMSKHWVCPALLEKRSNRPYTSGTTQHNATCRACPRRLSSADELRVDALLLLFCAGPQMFSELCTRRVAWHSAVGWHQAVFLCVMQIPNQVLERSKNWCTTDEIMLGVWELKSAIFECSGCLPGLGLSVNGPICPRLFLST
jgi:hypothetical protein